MKNSVKVVYIWNVDYFDLGFAPPPLWNFSTICDISCLDGSPKKKKVNTNTGPEPEAVDSSLNKKNLSTTQK